MELEGCIIEFYRKVATELPQDVLKALRSAGKKERGPARKAMEDILKNIEVSKKDSKPICQDSGTPIFYVKLSKKVSRAEVKSAIINATGKVTKAVPLRPNAVDSMSGKNSGDNTGLGIPVIYFEDWDKAGLKIDLFLKGGGSENVGRTYSLPDKKLKAERNLLGVRKCIIDAVFRAQGNGCPPYIVGVGIGSPRVSVVKLSDMQLLRKLDDSNMDKELAGFENGLVKELNELGIGPLGLGGKNTVLGVKISSMHRHPASFFVDVSLGCWAMRRGTMEYKNGKAKYY